MKLTVLKLVYGLAMIADGILYLISFSWINPALALSAARLIAIHRQKNGRK